MEQKRVMTSRGYVQIIWADPVTGKLRRDYEHRLVWEAAYGPIPPGFILHHKNGDKTDNRLENLELLDKRSHARKHGWKRWRRG